MPRWNYICPNVDEIIYDDPTQTMAYIRRLSHDLQHQQKVPKKHFSKQNLTIKYGAYFSLNVRTQTQVHDSLCELIWLHMSSVPNVSWIWQRFDKDKERQRFKDFSWILKIRSKSIFLIFEWLLLVSMVEQLVFIFCPHEFHEKWKVCNAEIVHRAGDM